MADDNQIEARTEATIASLYDAFLDGDAEKMMSLFSAGISLRFLGQVDARGIAEAREFLAFAAGLLTDVNFQIEQTIIDGAWAAVVWRETARTQSGAHWENHGVDVIRADDGRITVLHENNDVRLVARHFPRYVPSPNPA